MEILESDIDFTPLHERMASYVDQGILSCVNSLIMRGTDVLDFYMHGSSDLESDLPLAEDSIFRMYSNTKIVTSVAIMQLVERGELSLDDQLGELLPGFGDMTVLKESASDIDDVVEATQPITLRHLLSHSAGLSYGFIEPESVIDRAYLGGGVHVLGGEDVTLEEFCHRVAKLPLAYQPGSSWRYSVATDVLARIVEVKSGQRFDEYLEAHIFAPLGMVDTGFHVPEEKQDRFTTLYAPEDPLSQMKPGLVRADDPRQGGYSRSKKMLSGGGGLTSTVSDYLTFLRAIVSGGSWAGARILNEESIALMRTNQLAPGVNVQFPFWDMPGVVFGLGFALREQVVGDDHPKARNEYFWGGMAGTHTWMAPEAGITGMCMTQRMPGFWHPFSHEFRAMAYQLAAT